MLLGSSQSKKNLATKFEVCSIFKPNAPVAKIVEDVRKLHKDLTKKDHIVIVGGAGNSLDTNQYCLIKISTSLQRGQVTQM
jgi:hypothetical protein